MIKGFVFGKFLPYHKGHEGMINFALTQCDFLTILICCSDKESIKGDIRRSWVEGTFKNSQNIELIVYDYLEDQLPNTSKSSESISLCWAEIFKKILPGHDIV